MEEVIIKYKAEADTSEVEAKLERLRSLMKEVKELASSLGIKFVASE